MELYKELFNHIEESGKISIYSFQLLYMTFSKENDFEHRYAMSCLELVSRSAFIDRVFCIEFLEDGYHKMKDRVD